jgi:predicted alpha/beta-fold hydrolase
MIVKQMFNPPFPLNNRHVQPLYSSLFRKQPKPKVELERFDLNDGDFVDCYWHNSKPSDERPIVILFHGLAGSFNSPYIQGAMRALEKKGFASVLMHFRGCSGKPNLLPRSYHSGDTADAKAWIDYLKVKYEKSSLYAVGYSIGGNMLLKLLGEEKENTPLKAAISVSAPMDLAVCAEVISKGFSKNYENYLLKPLCLALEEKFETHDMKALIELKKEEIKDIKTIEEFDERYTAPIHGFGSAKNYYAKCSSKQFLKYIAIPTHIIHALDDPFMDERILPTEEERSSSVSLDLTPHGGHVGFVAGSLFKPRYWLEERIADYFFHQNASQSVSKKTSP